MSGVHTSGATRVFNLLYDIHVCMRESIIIQYLCVVFCPYAKQLSLILWSRVFLEKLTVAQLLKKYPASYGTQMFITVFTTIRHWSLFRVESIPHPPILHP
jgi:hypothetical protein